MTIEDDRYVIMDEDEFCAWSLADRANSLTWSQRGDGKYAVMIDDVIQNEYWYPYVVAAKLTQ